MHYCFIAETEVYGCDHYDCNAGTQISGMIYCHVYGEHVYSCDHAECN